MASLSSHLSVALGLTTLTTFLLGAFVYFYKRGSNTSKIFLFYCLSISWWSLFQLWHHNSVDKHTSLLAARLMTAGGSFLIPTLFLHFVFSLLELKSRKWLLPSAYMLSLIFAGLSATSYMITDAEPKFYLRYLLEPGPIYPIAVFFFLSCVMYGHYELYKAYARSFGLKRNQLAQLFWSSLLGYIGGSANFLMVFDLNVPFLNPFGTYALPLYVAATTYAIVKYRLWEKLLHIGVVYIPAFFYHFCVSFLQAEKHNKRVLANYLISTVFLLLIPTPYLINDHYSFFWGYYSKAGPLHPLYLTYFASVSLASLLKLYRGAKAKEESSPLEATRIKYVFWAFAIGYLASADFVQSYGYEFYPFGYFFVTLWVLIVSYATLKYQLLDISHLTKTPQAALFLQALALIPLYLAILLLLRVFTGSTEFVLAGVPVFHL